MTHAGMKGRGAYLYIIKGDRVLINGKKAVPALGAVMAADEPELVMEAEGDSAELLLVDVPLI